MARPDPLAKTIAAIAAIQSENEMDVPTEGLSVRDLQRLADSLAAFGQVTRLRVVLYLRDGEASPKSLAKRFGLPLGQVAHHARVLKKAGMIKETRTVPRRGATEHFYVLTDASLDVLRTLGLEQTDRTRPQNQDTAEE
jgi:DNA-binding transcriptional ArsR family regulator